MPQDDDQISTCASVKSSKDKLEVSAEEEKFLKRLFGFMEKDNTPIGRLPTLGCKEG
jgi:hypothetical protein